MAAHPEKYVLSKRVDLAASGVVYVQSISEEYHIPGATVTGILSSDWHVIQVAGSAVIDPV